MILRILSFNTLLVLTTFLAGISVSCLAGIYPTVFKNIGIISTSILFLILVSYFILRILNWFVPRRFANSIFVIDTELNLALIFHKHYRRYQPPGARLGYHESPHLAVARVMKEELGLDSENYLIVSNETKLIKYGQNQIVPKPYLVKTELGRHRLGIVEHYDFVYVCLANSCKPTLNSPLKPAWYSLEELKELSKDAEIAPWGDVIPIYERICSEIAKIRNFENLKLHSA